MQTKSYSDLLALAQALIGAGSLTTEEQAQVLQFVNRRAHEAYQTSESWPRYMVANEPRTIVADQTVPYSEDSFYVFGAGTYEVNGLYVRNGDAYESKNNYQIVKSSGITVSGAGSSAVNSDQYVQTNTFNGKPYYTDGTKFIQWVSSGTPQWQIDTLYYSTDDVATPDLVTTWLQIEGIGGSLPVPSVSANNEEWQLVDQNDLVIYNVASTSSTPPETGWASDNGEDPAPTVVDLPSISEFIRIHRTQPFVNRSALEYDFYTTARGAHIMNISGGEASVAYVTYKKEFTPFTASSTDIPQEWFYFIAHGAYADFLRVQDKQEEALAEEQIAGTYLALELEKIDNRVNNTNLVNRFSTYVSRQAR
jgi:hypothetical protein